MDWPLILQLIPAVIVIILMIVRYYKDKKAKQGSILTVETGEGDPVGLGKFSVKQSNLKMVLEYEIFSLENEQRKKMGEIKEDFKWFTFPVNLFQLYALVGFNLKLRDTTGKILQVYKQGFGYNPLLKVFNEKGNLLVTYKRKIKKAKDLWEMGIYEIIICDPAGTQIGWVKADVFEPRYKIFDNDNNLLGKIDKPFKNLPFSKKEAKEMMTESFWFDDKFVVEFYLPPDDPRRKIIFGIIPYITVNFHLKPVILS